MKYIKRLMTILLVVLGSVVIFGCDDTNEVSSVANEEATEAEYFKFVAKDFDGNLVNESIFKGHKITMINVWGTFCSPCISEMPDLAQLPQEYSTSDFQLIGICGDVLGMNNRIDEDIVADAKYIIDKTGADYLMLLNSQDLNDGVLADMMYYPTTFFVDEDGVILDTVVGSMDKDDWISIIDEFVK